ncbi:hypothetical protein L228DRAFT_255290 [Xylona heveae TC161]|uniref:glutathione transferase n=1 Tax=Xylona heveae (strain CBS 132557 / TC161) TaxID=1328760 RepID=A0A165HTY3_XYLHT|nr:hypothetical protein L228DRAFT_255290 [Xylona heveae TC161]KZF23922.1 hypothetical protein L228DRAFT_255290 [Xylona heveae TC161]
MSSETTEDLSQHPPIAADKLVLYVKKASPTSTANSVKPLMLLEALSIPHDIHIINSTSNETWFHAVNPYKMVPAIEDVEVYQSSAGHEQRLNVFDSSACLTYLVDKYDKDGLYGGKDLIERTIVMNWLMSYTAGLGATGKWWLLMKPRAETVGEAIQVLVRSIKSEYSFLEKRLNEPGQKYVALPDRPTITDFAIFPLANEQVAATAEIDFSEWPKLKEWSENMSKFPPVARALHRICRFGLSEEELTAQGL